MGTNDVGHALPACLIGSIGGREAVEAVDVNEVIIHDMLVKIVFQIKREKKWPKLHRGVSETHAVLLDEAVHRDGQHTSRCINIGGEYVHVYARLVLRFHEVLKNCLNAAEIT